MWQKTLPTNYKAVLVYARSHKKLRWSAKVKFDFEFIPIKIKWSYKSLDKTNILYFIRTILCDIMKSNLHIF